MSPARSAAMACGVWSDGRRVVLVPVDEEGTAGRARVITGRRDDVRWVLLEAVDRQEGLGWALVLPEAVARMDTIAQLALTRGVRVWLAPDGLVRDIRALHRISERHGAAMASAIARLLITQTMRRHLRRVDRPDRRQLTLL